MERLRARVESSLPTLPYALIALGAVLRILPHPPNFAPIAAIALFGGAVLSGVPAVAAPLGALFISDIVLGFYPGWAWVYGSFILVALIGMTLRHNRSPLRIAGAALLSSVVFFVLTNLGEWFGPLYPHTLAGLRADFVAAIPFFRATALSDLAYSAVLFGLYEAAVRCAGHTVSGAAPTQRTT
jgi:uncharacterized membrane protein